ncbi:MAG: cytochrome c oxidase subunit 3 [Acidobacteria bacterium]|nr:cytochrome c oxidase subunit 3 [Acidobacteriota bacterium]
MATTVHDPSAVQEREESLRTSGGSGNGRRNLVPASGDLRRVEDCSPHPSTTGIWVGLAAIAMSFLALTSAMIVRKGSWSDWQHFTLPSVLYLNTAVLLASSVSLEISRRRMAAYMGRPRTAGFNSPAGWLYLTLALGLTFIAGQCVAWAQLSRQGLYLSSNPSSSFFYVFTAAHALHVLGGLGGLILVIYRFEKSVLRRSTLDVASRYWHFMDVLWIYLLILLWAKL